jgi:aspartate/methionine/tyrosine aminotransferase
MTGHRPFMRAVLDDIRHNPGAEIVRYARRRPGILSLGMGESDSPTPSFISDAVSRALAEGQTFYGPVLGRAELRAALAAYHKNIYGAELAPERVVVTASGTAAIHLALISVLEKDDEVVTVFPIWKNLMGAMQLQQAQVKGINLKQTETGWALDLDALFAAVTEKTRVLVVVTPNNPAGWMMSRAEIKTVTEFARARGIWIIADEVYGRLSYGAPRAPSFLDFAEPEDRLFVIGSFSKNWAMTGWRLGWLIGPAAAESRLYDLILYDSMGPPNFTQAAAAAALTPQGEDFIAAQKKQFIANRDAVWDAFAGMNGRIRAVKPEASFYAFFQIDGEPDCMTLARRLIDEAGLGLAPGCAFGVDFKGWIRLCYAVSRPKLADALDRLRSNLI